MKFDKDAVYKVHLPRWVIPGASHSVRVQGDAGQLVRVQGDAGQLVLVPLYGDVPGSPAGIVLEKLPDSKTNPTAEDFAKGESRPCVRCGRMKSCVYTTDPYKADVDNKDEWGWWCYPCHEATADDV